MDIWVQRRMETKEGNVFITYKYLVHVISRQRIIRGRSAIDVIEK